MDSLTIELVSKASLNCYPHSSISCFTNYLREQIHFQEKFEVAISKCQAVLCSKKLLRESFHP